MLACGVVSLCQGFLSRMRFSPYALCCAGFLTLLAGEGHAQNPRPVIIPGLPVPVFVPPVMPPTLPVATGQVVPPGASPAAVPGGARPAAPTPPAPTPTPPVPAGASDGHGYLPVAFLQAEAGQILRDLVAALPDDKKRRVDGIPMMIDDTSGEVNAFAGCENGGAFMAITTPLLRAMGHLAEAKAADELFGSQRLNQYTRQASDSLRGGGPVPDPPANFYSPAEGLDPRKLTRQRDVFDEMAGFVLGHELGHHYLGHTGCANGQVSGAIDPARIGRIATTIVPAFNQANEVAADLNGTQNFLDVGPRRPGRVPTTEMGGVMTLEFLGSLETTSATSIVLGILRTHPHPRLRIPLIQTTAQNWRATHGAGGKSNVGFPFPFPFPFPGG